MKNRIHQLDARRFRNRPRGFVLFVVLTCVAVLMLVGALVYSSAADQQTTTIALRNQAIANARANQAARRAILMLRQAVLPAYMQGIYTLPVCDDVIANHATCASVALENAGGQLAGGAASGGGDYGDVTKFVTDGNRRIIQGADPDADLTAGYGLLYDVRVYREQRIVTQPPKLVVFATGYYGLSAAQTTGGRFMSQVLVEMSMPQANAIECTGGYCGGS